GRFGNYAKDITESCFELSQAEPPVEPSKAVTVHPRMLNQRKIDRVDHKHADTRSVSALHSGGVVSESIRRALSLACIRHRFSPNRPARHLKQLLKRYWCRPARAHRFEPLRDL